MFDFFFPLYHISSLMRRGGSSVMFPLGSRGCRVLQHQPTPPTQMAQVALILLQLPSRQLNCVSSTQDKWPQKLLYPVIYPRLFIIYLSIYQYMYIYSRRSDPLLIRFNRCFHSWCWGFTTLGKINRISSLWGCSPLIRGSLDKFPDFFRMGTFIDSTHMKL